MNLVTISNNIKGGVPVVSGTRIPVRSVVFLHKRLNKSPLEIISEYYTQLSLDQTVGILRWYDNNNKNYDGLDI